MHYLKNKKQSIAHIRKRMISRNKSMKSFSEKIKKTFDQKRIIKQCQFCYVVYKVKSSRKNKSKFCSKRCWYNWKSKNIPAWNKGKKYLQISGKNHYCWKGGITPLYFRIRNMIENRKWIKSIFQRDRYICQKCNIHSGLGEKIYLVAHHIKPFHQICKEFLTQYSQFSPIEDKETLLRLAITYQPFWNIGNGITLCRECHKYLPKKTIVPFL